MYQTLYRKYRPKKFKEIMGQDIIVKTLKNSILNHQMSHAYLFIGPRGTGKTSTAKIFARAVNCFNTDDGDLCDECEMCKASNDHECLDIIEIDAASNNGVDEIRNLREKVVLVPSELKYKVYIIDEVHMLTISAFNALLKTLEEPPEHIIFILATTDPQKVPETIISRCQSFHFSRISEDSIVKNLSMICEKEKIDCDESILQQIAILSDGGMRDSLGMLDKLNSYKTGKITMDDFLDLNGLITNQSTQEFIDFVVSGNIESVIRFIEEWNNKGKNLIQIMIQLLDCLKDLLVEYYIHDTSNQNIPLLQQLANLINEKMYDIKRSSNPKIYIEIMLLDFMNQSKIISREIISDSSVVVDKNVVEEEKTPIMISKKEKSKNIKNQEDQSIISSNIKQIMKIRVNNAFTLATKTELNQDKVLFKRLEDYTFDQNIGYLVCALLDGNLRMSSSNYLVISYEYDSVVVENLNHLEEMEKVLKQFLNVDKKIAIISDSEWNVFAKEFVDHKKNGILYQFIEEPKLMFNSPAEKENKEENKQDNDSASSIFGDIVEVC